MTPRIVPRDEWQTEYNPTWEQHRRAGRRQPFTVRPEERKGLVPHNNGPNVYYSTEAQEIRLALNISAYHWRSLRWSDAAYSWMVGNVTGNAYEIRGLWWDQFANGDDQVGPDDGDDTDWYTAMWIGGNYQPVSAKAIEGFEMLLEHVRGAGAGKRCLPHNAFRVKPCPGPTLTDWAYDHDNRDLETDMPVPFIDDWNRYFNDQPRGGEPDYIVYDIERRLKELGYPLKVDGTKGKKTIAAVEQFKVDHMGSKDPNANLGKDGWAKLREITSNDTVPAPTPRLPDTNDLIDGMADQAIEALERAKGAVDAIAALVES